MADADHVLPARSAIFAVNTNAPLATTLTSGTVYVYVFQLCDPVVGTTVVPKIVNVVPPVSCSLETNDVVMIHDLPICPETTGANDPVNDVRIGF